MAQLGIGLSSEERSVHDIARAAALADDVGFRNAGVSDRFHPWIDTQGETPVVLSAFAVPVVGARA